MRILRVNMSQLKVAYEELPEEWLLIGKSSPAFLLWLQNNIQNYSSISVKISSNNFKMEEENIFYVGKNLAGRIQIKTTIVVLIRILKLKTGSNLVP